MLTKSISIVVLVFLFLGCEQVDRVEDVAKKYQDDTTEKTEKISDDIDQGLGATSGKELYNGTVNTSSCAGCHGSNAEKRALGKSDIIRHWEVETIIQALQEYKEGTRDQYGMGSLMTGQVKYLSDSDIRNIANYIYNLD